ncbi:hypothetical protein O4444_05540 [Xylella fastidiosa subsp. pauca]|nr:hypothetical protein [Xylella fastidiosa]WGZ33055.1 hypothetical protein O4444_05540 [Xylella fastidiosa subsp. pauca]
MALISVLHGAGFVFGSAANPVTPGGLPILFAPLGSGHAAPVIAEFLGFVASIHTLLGGVQHINLTGCPVIGQA